MTVDELYVLYRQAIQLIRVGRNEDALALLREIDRERPGTKNVLYPMAVCLENLGRFEEALACCGRLITEHDSEKARLMKARLEKAARDSELPKVDLVSALGIDAPAPPPAKAAPAPQDGNKGADKKKRGWFSGK